LKIIRFEDPDGIIRLGEVSDPSVGASARLLSGDLLGALTMTEEVVEVARLLAPLEPTNIIAIGLNYRKHAEEGGAAIPEHPLVFAKLTSSLLAPGEAIQLPQAAPDEVDFEAELAVVIGKRARHVSEEDALSHVLGYLCANDVSARDCQKHRDRQWTRGKSFDTFCPLGPCLVIDSNIDPNALPIRSRLDGRVMQESNTADMIFSVPQLISYLSKQFTLLPGTVILTGTPEGVGFARDPAVYLREGNTIEIEIDGIGTLVNPVQCEQVAT
jgi:2-keto-4-pentenoate hydratase/2-oxohepta-3-ene-1,7-dioic acid hydratase in catechol pathway